MSLDILFQKANELYLSGALSEAEKIYRQLLEFSPQNPDILNMLGLIAQAKGLDAEAVDMFVKALQKAPNALPVYFNMAVSLSNLKKYDEALQAYEKVLLLNPNQKEAYNNIGAIYEKSGNTELALENYAKAIALDPEYVEPQANSALLQKDKSTLFKLAEKYPAHPLAFYDLALLFQQEKNFNKALDYALKAFNLEKNAQTALLTAETYTLLSDHENAAKFYAYVLTEDKKNVEALLFLGTYEQDESYFKTALDLAPQNADTHTAYADFLYQHQRTLEALEEYRKAVILNPDLPEISNNLALILKDNGDYKGAIDLFLNALIKSPQNEDIAINLAQTLVLLHQTEPELALKTAKDWLAFTPENIFAKHTVSAFTNTLNPNDSAYAEVLFDHFAKTYDATMQNIEYAVFEELKKQNITLSGKILDLGCGTGLAAQHLKTEKNTFDGVDLSKNMLQECRSKGLYNALYQDDIFCFLKKNKVKYNFILAFDVIEYITQIEELIKLISPTSVIFTIENAEPEIKTFQMDATGRYKHNPNYILTLLKESGYRDITHSEFNLRLENGRPVLGTLFIAKSKS